MSQDLTLKQQLEICKAALEKIKDAPISLEEMVEEARKALMRCWYNSSEIPK